MLTIKNLTVTYASVPVLKELSVCFESGCIHGLVGLNGSGKTTLFNAIYKWPRPYSGEICWNGRALSARDISLLETKNYFYSGITGREYLSLFPSPGGKFDLESWQQLFDLPLDAFIESYSTGMKKKLALAGVIKLNKPILLLDEPFNGIDMEATHVIKLLLQKLKKQQKTVLITSHVLETLTGTCDYIHHLTNKKIEKKYAGDEGIIIENALFNDSEERLRKLLDKGLGQ